MQFQLYSETYTNINDHILLLLDDQLFICNGCMRTDQTISLLHLNYQQTYIFIKYINIDIVMQTDIVIQTELLSLILEFQFFYLSILKVEQVSFIIQSQQSKGMTQYIPKECEQSVKSFKYRGGTASYSYDLIWSPLAQRLTEMFPVWMAPNIITLIALLILLISHIIFCYIGDNSKGVANWKLVMMGITILVYQTLDNIDGKQARRTKSSSVLGMLLDHGSDAISGFFITFQMGDVLFIQDADMIFMLAFLFVMMGFFLAMSTQYVTGEFRLGRINAVDEGLPSYALICIIASIFDFSFLKNQHWLGTYLQQLILFLICLNLVMQYSMIKNIFQKAKKRLLQIAIMWLLPITVAVGILSLRFWGPSNILQEVKYTFVYTMMFMWARNMILIQLCSVTNQSFKVYNIGTITFLFGVAFYLLNYNLEILEIDIFLYFRIFLIIQAIVFIEFVSSTFIRIAEILNIKILTIPH